MKIVILNGTIGVGKLTTAKKLADVTDYPILHNHLTRDLAINFFKPNSDAYTRLVWDIRLSVVNELINDGCHGLIWTSLTSGSPVIRKYYEELERVVRQTGGEVYYVHLSCELNEQKKRVVGDDRKEHKKIFTVEEFEQRMKTIELFTATPPERTIEIDNTKLLPEEVAMQIVTIFNLDEKSKEIKKELTGSPDKPTFKIH
jgi:adenylate kinase family enzyme